MVATPTYTTEDFWQITFLASGENKPPRCESGSIEGTEAGSRHCQSKNKCANATKDLLAKSNGDRVGGVYDGAREDEVVGYIGEDVGEYNKRHRGMYDARKITGGVYEFASHVVDLGRLAD
jgi:hypothetical protein